MLLPGIVLLVVFHLIPMFGIVIAFQDFNIGLGLKNSPWIGLENFKYLFEIRDSKVIFANTVFLATGKIVMHLLVPLVFAILLNELKNVILKRWVQTIVYLPHFLSWVILAGVIIDMLDDPKVTAKKIRSAVTDSGTEVRFDQEEKPGVSNLLTIYSALTGESVAALEEQYAGRMYGDLKKDLAEVVVEFVTPFRERTLELLDDQDHLMQVLARGAETAGAVAEATLRDVYQRVGFVAPTALRSPES